MRYLLFSAVILLSASTFAAAQKVAGTQSEKPAANKPATRKRAKPAFTREEFDPRRDPAIDLAAAIETAAKTGRRIILDVGGEWCGWCVYMDIFFYQNPRLKQLRDDNFVWLKVNMSGENENKAFLGQFPKRSGYPHLYVLDETGTLLQSQETAPLESGKGYHLGRFKQFLTDWSPKKTAIHVPDPAAGK